MAPIGLDEYQQFTTRTDRNDRPGVDGLDFVLLGLFGEIGSLLSVLKKKQRDKDAFLAYGDAILEEFGDSLWYLANAALRAEVKFSLIADRALSTRQTTEPHPRSGSATFADLQGLHQPLISTKPSAALQRQLLVLAGKVGTMLEHWTTQHIRPDRDALSADMAGIFNALLLAADNAGVSLNDAVLRNIEKTLGRWPDTPTWGSLFDEHYPHEEQLPRQMTVHFIERIVRGRLTVVQKYNGVTIGSELTDNRLAADDYRFHDVFHLAYAAILGWSPTLRALLKLKRKSCADVDENEDGARARIIEEGISTWVFNHAAQNAYFETINILDYGLLKAVHELVRGYEVSIRPLWQWEVAILQGFRVFRELRRYRGGAVTIDLNQRTIAFNPTE